MTATEITDETLADLRSRYAPLLGRTQAAELLAELHHSRRVLEKLCKENPDGFRKTILNGTRYKYRREFLIEWARRASES